MVVFLFVISLGALIHIIFTWINAIEKGDIARRNKGNSELNNLQVSTYPFVSIIIPAWNEFHTLQNCVNSVLEIDYPRWEALIVAGGPDGTYEKAVSLFSDKANLLVIEQRPYGKNAALNQGLKLSKGEIIVLLDADSIVTRGWLKALISPLSSTVKASTGSSIPARTSAITIGEQMERISAYEVHKIVTLQGNSSIALERNFIEQLGGFPENVKVGVDWDLNARLLEKGIVSAYCSEAKIITERPATVKEFWKNEVRWRRAHLNSLFRHSGLFLKTPADIFLNLYIYLVAWFVSLLAIGAFVLFSVGYTSLIWLLAIIVFWLTARRASLAGEFAAYTHDYRQLKTWWIPPFLLLITLLAIIPSSITYRCQVVHFKGPRYVGN